MLIRNFGNALCALMIIMLAGCEGGVLDPKGQVGIDEKQLIIIATLLMLIVVVPVIFMTLYFAWKYRDGRDHEIYAPKWAHSKTIEFVVWLVPIVIVVILGVIAWGSTHRLDPYKPLEHEAKPITIEVVSLNWKWLFIYPEQGIASVNELAFPVNVPVNFKISSDTAMNSFFIPQLGSQIYSMAGMTTKLHLIANEPGTYKGISANYSGAGFTGMKFNAIATSTQADFDAWVAKVKNQGQRLDGQSYHALAEESSNDPVAYYGSVSSGLFDQIVMQYMHHNNMPHHQGTQMHAMHSAEHASANPSDEMTMYSASSTEPTLDSESSSKKGGTQ